MDSRASPAPPAVARPKNSASSISSSRAPTSSPQSATMASSSKGTRGSTPTAGRSSAKVAEADKPARAASKDSLKPKLVKKADDHPRPSKSEEQLKALKSDFDGLRSHLTCKICDRLLYQPYIISCGHTYCYTCLCTWFGAHKSHKTCPDCRVVVSQPPAPAYVIRDMTNVFISRAELLPSGETVEEHKKWQKEEADAVQLDKDNPDPRSGGLFKGSFRPQPHSRSRSVQVIRDREDGVDRCPMCQWELEDGECLQCGLLFDDNGELTWGDSFNGFSDMDEMSERDTEDLDHEMDMEDGDFDGYDEQMDGWQDYLPDQSSFMMRRFLEAGIPPQAAFGRRRPMSHSEAGSRRSYSQSIVSDMFTDEMDTVEEEDEEGLDGESSSINGFIDDEEMESSSSATASSTPGPTAQSSNNRRRNQARARRVVESETSSTISSVIEEDEDEEDQGPIRRGQRNRAQTRILNRANGSRSSNGPPSSTSTDASVEELDEDTQALLQSEGWMLQHDGPDDEMGEDDDDSDGGRTTVGWEPTAISNDRVRMGGSLTPTADRPRPSAPIRPPSRVGTARFMHATRGLRRRSSVLSTSTVNYEDGEADDDDSDPDGDISMAMNALRSRRSQLQMRNSTNPANPPSRFANRGPSQGDAVDLDTDDNSDNSQPGNRRNRRMPRREYDPRISWMFAAHQRALQEEQMAGTLIDIEPRATTPIARPRTSNRNRPSPAQAFSPFMPPSRLRTPLMDNSSNMAAASRVPVSPPRRNVLSPTLPTASSLNNAVRAEQAPSVSSSSNTSTILTPGSSTPTSQTSQQSVDSIAQIQAAAAIDMIDRPPSRVSARPPSANGRRNSAGFSPVYQGFPHSNVGLNIQGRIFPHQVLGNPWGAFVQPRVVRNRNSRQLRDQSSTATLRPANSRANIRETAMPQQGMRQQASRINLRPQPSQRRLNTQASTRTLRASEHARPPPSPTANAPTTQATTRSPRFTPDERDALARDLINNRMRALAQPGAGPARTNPFVSGFRRPSLSNETPAASIVTTSAPHHVRSNSNESVNSVTSTGTTQGAPASPALGRRRSNRNMASAPPSGVLPPSQGTYAPQGNTYTNNYFRARQGSFSGATPPFESSLNSNTRGMSPMMAGPLI